MANREKGEVVLAWGKRELVLVLDINALAELEDLRGEKLRDLVPQLADPSLNLLKAVLWAATREHAADLDLKTCGRVIQAVGIEAVQVKITEAVRAAFPEAKAAEGEAGGSEPDPPAPGTGGGS